MKQLTKPQKIIILRNGIQLWFEEEKIETIRRQIESPDIRFITFTDTGETINTADVLGIFTPQTIEEMTRRKNGEWKCEENTWHKKGDFCECKRIKAEKKRTEEFKKKYRPQTATEAQKAKKALKELKQNNPIKSI